MTRKPLDQLQNARFSAKSPGANGLTKLQNVIINRIHFNSFGRAGSLDPGRLNRMYFIVYRKKSQLQVSESG